MSVVSTVFSRACVGIKAPLVEVQVHISDGVPKFSLVGLPETSVKEAKERVRSALLSQGFEFPQGQITVHLAPADLPKEGGRYDLAIALGILMSSGQMKRKLDLIEAIAELTLEGHLRPIKGIIPTAIACQKKGHTLITSAHNATSASLIPNLDVRKAHTLSEVVSFIGGHDELAKASFSDEPSIKNELSIEDVKGQEHAKRALVLAASGGHHMLMSGPPGTGKTMLAQRLKALLPPLTIEEAIETLSVRSLSDSQLSLTRSRPFCQPHHSSTPVAIVGGGRIIQPGDISYAHKGVLFLDELPEFERQVIELLREPLESGEIHISRANQKVTFPAQFQLIAAMNPCPCGYLGDKNKDCSCTLEAIHKYQAKLSGPFLDRIDLHVQVHRISHEALLTPSTSNLNEHEHCLQRVEQTRDMQIKRQGKLNSQLGAKEIGIHCAMEESLRSWFVKALDKLTLSSRAMHRILKLSRTIADFENSERLERSHLLEALSFRQQPIKQPQWRA